MIIFKKQTVIKSSAANGKKLIVKKVEQIVTPAPHSVLPYGLVVRIPGFHPGGPGSIPGVGTYFCLIIVSFFISLFLLSLILDTFDRGEMNVI